MFDDVRRHVHYHLDPDAGKDWLEHAIGLFLLFLCLVVALSLAVALGMVMAEAFIHATH